MKHLTDEQLNARLDQQPAGRSEEIERHLTECAQCRTALAALTTQDRFLGAALAHDPGDEYFATFAARVEDRLRAESLRGAQARLGHDQAPWLRWFQAPRRIAWMGAVATVVAGAAIVIVTSRDDRVATIAALEDRQVQSRFQKSVPSAPSMSSSDEESAPSGEADSRSSAAVPPPATGAQSADDVAALPPAPSGASPARMRQVGPSAQRGADASPPAPGPVSAPAPEGQGHRVMKRNVALPLEADRSLAANEAKKVDEVRQESAPAPATLQARDAAGPTAEKEKASATSGSSLGFAAPPAAGGLAAAPRAGEVQLCGQVIDPDGRPVARASVALVTIGRTATSSEAGEFCLSAPEGSYELSVMAIGFQTSRLQVRVAGERSDVRVTMSAISVLDGAAKSAAGRLDAGEAVKLNTTTGTKKAAKPAPAPAKDQAKAKAPPVDPFAGESKSAKGLTTTAMEATRFASTYPTIPTWEKAARAWTTALTALKTPAGRGEAHYRIAQAKLYVWRSYPNQQRKNDVLSACMTVLSGTPTLAQRKDVMRWMAEVRSGPIGRD